MKGRRLIIVSLNVMDDLINGKINAVGTGDIPSDVSVAAVWQTNDDRLRDELTVLVESSEWPAVPEGSIPPRIAPTYMQRREGG